MFFREAKPSLALAPFVESFWLMEFDCGNGDERFVERVLPECSAEIIFHLGDRIGRVNGENKIEAEPRQIFIGQNAKFYRIAAKGSVKMLGVKFRPHAAAFGFRENAAPLTDKAFDLTDLLGDSIKSRRDALKENADFSTRLKILEKWLGEIFRGRTDTQFDYLDFAVNKINQTGGLSPIEEIARKIGVSNRYLEKIFLARVGVSPKLFARLAQFQRGVKLLNQFPRKSLTEISYDAGYCDQSHFIRAVKEFSGVTPSVLRREKLPMQTPFLSPLEN